MAFLGGACCPRHVFANGILIERRRARNSRVSTFTVSSPSFSCLSLLSLPLRGGGSWLCSTRIYMSCRRNAAARGVATDVRGITLASNRRHSHFVLPAYVRTHRFNGYRFFLSRISIYREINPSVSERRVPG